MNSTIRRLATTAAIAMAVLGFSTTAAQANDDGKTLAEIIKEAQEKKQQESKQAGPNIADAIQKAAEKKKQEEAAKNFIENMKKVAEQEKVGTSSDQYYGKADPDETRILLPKPAEKPDVFVPDLKPKTAVIIPKLDPAPKPDSDQESTANPTAAPSTDGQQPTQQPQSTSSDKPVITLSAPPARDTEVNIDVDTDGDDQDARASEPVQDTEQLQTQAAEAPNVDNGVTLPLPVLLLLGAVLALLAAWAGLRKGRQTT